MSRYVPAAVAAVVLGLGLGMAQGLLGWGPWPLFLSSVGAVFVIGMLAIREDL